MKDGQKNDQILVLIDGLSTKYDVTWMNASKLNAAVVPFKLDLVAILFNMLSFLSDKA